MLILGIETSCDETAAAVIKASNKKVEVLSNIVSSQIELHSKWGGVVPNLAAREHLKNILPVIESSLSEANITQNKIDLIAVTNGPGLIPALLIGTSTAKTLSYLWKKPLLGIHHVEGHIYANFVSDKRQATNTQEISFPVLALVVSGGHTQLVLMKDNLQYEIIGETLDDAAGEAFDKVARILNLGYPGGPIVSKQAEEFMKRKNIEKRFNISFPRPMLKSKNFNFSFSGLKTAVLYTVKNNENLLQDKLFIQEVSYEFQQAVVDTLVYKTLQAAKKYNPKTILLAGGVSANKELRAQLGKIIEKELPETKYTLPETKYSIDNATMIASAAFYRWEKTKDKKKLYDNWKNLDTNANLKLRSSTGL